MFAKLCAALHTDNTIKSSQPSCPTLVAKCDVWVHNPRIPALQGRRLEAGWPAAAAQLVLQLPARDRDFGAQLFTSGLAACSFLPYPIADTWQQVTEVTACLSGSSISPRRILLSGFICGYCMKIYKVGI